MSDDLTDDLSDEEFADEPADDDIQDGEPEDAELEDGEFEEPFDEVDEEEDEAGARPADTAGDEDEDEPDPDEVEADLDAILKDRIAAGDDEEDEEDDEGALAKTPSPTGLVERQETEMHCPHCFLLVQAETVAETGECGHCGGPIS